MSKVTIVFWSGTGNTETMANMVADGIKVAGGEAEVLEMENITPANLADKAVFALGSPSMGDEELEDTIVEPFISELEKSVSGKKIALFGSYGWGDGEWMRNWVDRMKAAGAEIIGGEGVIANEDPDDEAREACENLGKAMVS